MFFWKSCCTFPPLSKPPSINTYPMPDILAKDFYEQVHGHHQFLSKGTIVNLLDAYREALKEPEPEKKEENNAETTEAHLGN